MSAYRTAEIQRWLQRHPRVAFQFTPTYSFRMNLVERWVADWNENPRPFVWHKTADQILNNLAGYLNRVPGSGHQTAISPHIPLAPFDPRTRLLDIAGVVEVELQHDGQIAAMCLSIYSVVRVDD